MADIYAIQNTTLWNHKTTFRREIVGLGRFYVLVFYRHEVPCAKRDSPDFLVLCCILYIPVVVKREIGIKICLSGPLKKFLTTKTFFTSANGNH